MAVHYVSWMLLCFLAIQATTTHSDASLAQQRDEKEREIATSWRTGDRGVLPIMRLVKQHNTEYLERATAILDQRKKQFMDSALALALADELAERKAGAPGLGDSGDSRELIGRLKEIAITRHLLDTHQHEHGEYPALVHKMYEKTTADATEETIPGETEGSPLLRKLTYGAHLEASAHELKQGGDIKALPEVQLVRINPAPENASISDNGFQRVTLPEGMRARMVSGWPEWIQVERTALNKSETKSTEAGTADGARDLIWSAMADHMSKPIKEGRWSDMMVSQDDEITMRLWICPSRRWTIARLDNKDGLFVREAGSAVAKSQTAVKWVHIDFDTDKTSTAEAREMIHKTKGDAIREAFRPEASPDTRWKTSLDAFNDLEVMNLWTGFQGSALRPLAIMDVNSYEPEHDSISYPQQSEDIVTRIVKYNPHNKWNYVPELDLASRGESIAFRTGEVPHTSIKGASESIRVLESQGITERFSCDVRSLTLTVDMTSAESIQNAVTFLRQASRLNGGSSSAGEQADASISWSIRQALLAHWRAMVEPWTLEGHGSQPT